MAAGNIAILTVSDRSSRGERKDLSGPAIREWALKNKFIVASEDIVADEFNLIRDKLIQLSDMGNHLILTTGGTGFAARDVTPEATKAVIDREAPGFTEVIRRRSLEITPHAMLSRAVSGIRGNTLIINLPGSPKAVAESLSFIEKALPHAMELLKGNVTDCGNIIP